jgi:phage internal scaffolding protein
MSKNKTLIRSAYGEKQKVTLTTLDARTEQCHRDECDINKIIAKYDRTGVLNHVNDFEARYEDLTGLDYQTMLNTVANANSMFEGLPSEIRNQFANDPANFISFMDDENNNEKMYEMGLKQRPISEKIGSESDPANVVSEQTQSVENAPQAKEASNTSKTQ